MKDPNAQNKFDPRASHRRQFAWQILVPIVLSLIVALAFLVVLVFNAGQAPATNGKWAHISTMLLSMPVIIFSLLTLAIVLLLTWLIIKLRKAIPPFTGQVFKAVDKVNRITNRTTEKSLSPLIQGKAYFAGAKRLLSMAFHISSNREE
jgi:heme/copper-type cytochrome/quinol oxidase subunit 2